MLKISYEQTFLVAAAWFLAQGDGKPSTERGSREGAGEILAAEVAFRGFALRMAAARSLAPGAGCAL